jgi:cytoskeletal protein RodZ
MRFKQKEQGFGAIEALLIVIIVGLVGFAGWYVYNSQKSSNNTFDESANTNITAQSAQTTSEQPNKTKFNEYFTSLTLGKLAIGRQVGPPNDIPTDTTEFDKTTDQFCVNMVTKKAVPLGSYVESTYTVSTKQSNNPTKTASPRELSQGGSIGCETLDLAAGKYEYKAYINDILVVDLAYTVK